MAPGYLGTESHGGKRHLETSSPCNPGRSPYRPPWTMFDKPSRSLDSSVSHIPRHRVTKLHCDVGDQGPRWTSKPGDPQHPASEVPRTSRCSCEQAATSSLAPSSHRLPRSPTLIGPSLTRHPHLIAALEP